MIADPTFPCPNCGYEIKLTESLAAPLLETTRKDFQEQLRQRDEQVAEAKRKLQDEKEAIQKEKAALDEEIAARVKEQRKAIAEEEAKKARTALSEDLESKAKQLVELQELLTSKDKKLAESQQAEADFLKSKRELDEKARELDLTIEKRLAEGLSKEREKATKAADESNRLKIAEKEKIIQDMQKQLQDANRRAEQASQQLQGEVLELDLEVELTQRYPQDSIEPVPKGQSGADVLQRVNGKIGVSSGSILWESKRTKNWSDGWLPKLRADPRAAGADVAILISATMPRDIETFDVIDGVIVVSQKCAFQVATIIRERVMAVDNARQVGEGQQTKMELIYEYLTGQSFRQRVDAILEAFTAMQSDLESEKRSMTRIWAKRQRQIENAFGATAGMYGDLQGIAGKSLQEIEGLGLPLLEESESGAKETEALEE